MNRLFINKDWTTLKKLLAINAASGGSLTEYTATGNPLTFNTNVSKPLKSLLIPWTPAQSGSGDPSPENVRPISGVSTVTVYHSGADTSNPDTINVTFPAEAGTVYGGTVDLATGVLTVTAAYREFDGSNDENWGGATGERQAFPIQWPEVRAEGAGRVIACNQSIEGDRYSDDPGFGKINNTSGSYNIRTHLVDTNITQSEFRAFLAEHPLQLVCPLAIPQTYQLDPVTIATLKGVNNVWSDANGDITVKYLKKG